MSDTQDDCTCGASLMFGRIEDAIQTQSRQIAGLDTKIDVLTNRMFVGNGTPALVTRLDRLEQARIQHDEEVKKAADNRDRWTHGIAVAVLVNVISTAILAWMKFKGP